MPHHTCSHLHTLSETTFHGWESSLPPLLCSRGPSKCPLGGCPPFVRLSPSHLPVGLLSSAVRVSELSFCLTLLCFFSVLIIFLPGALLWPGLEFLSSFCFGKCFMGLISKASVALVCVQLVVLLILVSFSLFAISLSAGVWTFILFTLGSLVTWSQINRHHPTIKHAI